jgi:hypothetical protein
MSILPIETKFFGVNRPLKASFQNNIVNVQPRPRTQVGVAVGPVTNAQGQVFIQNGNIIEILPGIVGLAAGMVMRVTGTPAAGAATINGYGPGPGPSFYRVGPIVAGGQRFTLLNINDNALTIGVTAGAGNSTTFAGLTFTAFQAGAAVTVNANQVIIQDNATDTIQIAAANPIADLDNGVFIQVTGVPAGATIENYVSGNIYAVGSYELVAGQGQRFRLRNFANPAATIPVAPGGVPETATFTGLTFTAFPTQVGVPVGPVFYGSGQVFIQNAGTNTIEIAAPGIAGLDDDVIIQVSGVPAAGAATIAGYPPQGGVVNYVVDNFAPVAGAMRFTLLNVYTEAPVAVTAGAANNNFQGLTFTAFNYGNAVASPVRGLVIMDGSTIVDLMLNRRDGAAFPNGSSILVTAIVTNQVNNQTLTHGICELIVGPAPGGILDGEISIIPHELYGEKIDGDAIVTIFREDVWTALQPPVLETRVCLEVWSEQNN